MTDSHAQSLSVVQPRQRWLSYSLRTMLLVVTLFCIWLGVQVDRAQRQKRQVKAIEQLGGHVLYDKDYVYLPTAEPRGFDWLREYIGRDFFDTAVGIAIREMAVPDGNAVVILEEGDQPWSESRAEQCALRVEQEVNAVLAKAALLPHLRSIGTNSDCCSSPIFDSSID